MTLDQIFALQRNANALRREIQKYSDPSSDTTSSLLRDFLREREEILNRESSRPDYSKDKVREILQLINDSITEDEAAENDDKRYEDKLPFAAQSARTLDGDAHAGSSASYLRDIKDRLSSLDADVQSMSLTLSDLPVDGDFADGLVPMEMIREALNVSILLILVEKLDRECVSVYNSLTDSLQKYLEVQEHRLRRLHAQLLSLSKQSNTTTTRNTPNAENTDIAEELRAVQTQVRSFLISMFNTYILLGTLNATQLSSVSGGVQDQLSPHPLAYNPPFSNRFINPPYVAQLKKRLLLPATSTTRHDRTRKHAPATTTAKTQKRRPQDPEYVALPLQRQTRNIVDRLRIIRVDPIASRDMARLYHNSTTSAEAKEACESLPCHDLGQCIHISLKEITDIPFFRSMFDVDSEIHHHLVDLLLNKTTNVAVLLLFSFATAHIFLRLVWLDIVLRAQETPPSASASATAPATIPSSSSSSSSFPSSPDLQSRQARKVRKTAQDIVYAMGYPTRCVGVYAACVSFVNVWASEHWHGLIAGEIQSILIRSRVSLSYEAGIATSTGSDVGGRMNGGTKVGIGVTTTSTTSTTSNLVRGGNDESMKGNSNNDNGDDAHVASVGASNKEETTNASQSLSPLQQFRSLFDDKDNFTYVLDCLSTAYDMDDTLSRYAIQHLQIEDTHPLEQIPHELSASFPTSEIAKKLHFRQSHWYTRIFCESAHKIYDTPIDTKRSHTALSHTTLRIVLHQIAGTFPYDHPFHTTLLRYIDYPPSPSSLLSLPVPSSPTTPSTMTSDFTFPTICWKLLLSRLGQRHAQHIHQQYRSLADAYCLGLEYSLSRAANSVLLQSACIPRSILNTQFALPPSTPHPVSSYAKSSPFRQSLYCKGEEEAEDASLRKKQHYSTRRMDGRTTQKNEYREHGCIACGSTVSPVASSRRTRSTVPSPVHAFVKPSDTYLHPLTLSRVCRKGSPFKDLLTFAQALAQRIRFDPEITYYHLPASTPRATVSSDGLFSYLYTHVPNSAAATPLFRSVFDNTVGVANKQWNFSAVSESTFFELGDVSESVALFIQTLTKTPVTASRALFDLPPRDNASKHDETWNEADPGDLGTPAPTPSVTPGTKHLHLVNTQIVYSALLLLMGPFSNRTTLALRMDMWYEHFIQYTQLLHIAEQAVLQAREFNISSVCPISISYSQRFPSGTGYDRTETQVSPDLPYLSNVPCAVPHGWVRPHLVSVGTRKSGYFVLPSSAPAPGAVSQLHPLETDESDDLATGSMDQDSEAARDPLDDRIVWTATSYENTYRVLVGALILLLRAVRFRRTAVTEANLFPCSCSAHHRVNETVEKQKPRLLFPEHSLLRYVHQCKFPYASLKSMLFIPEEDARAKGFFDFFLAAMSQTLGQKTSDQFPNKLAQYIACSVFNS